MCILYIYIYINIYYIYIYIIYILFIFFVFIYYIYISTSFNPSQWSNFQVQCLSSSKPLQFFHIFPWQFSGDSSGFFPCALEVSKSHPPASNASNASRGVPDVNLQRAISIREEKSSTLEEHHFGDGEINPLRYIFFGKKHSLTNYLWVPRLPTTFLAGDMILGAAVWEPRTLLPSSERLHRHMEDYGNHGPEILRWSTRFFWGAFFLIANREITREQLRSPEGFFLGSLQSLNRFGVWLLTLVQWTKNGAIKKGHWPKYYPLEN